MGHLSIGLPQGPGCSPLLRVSFSRQVCPVVQCCLHCNVSLPKASSDWSSKEMNGQSLGRRDRHNFQGEREEEKKKRGRANFARRL